MKLLNILPGFDLVEVRPGIGRRVPRGHRDAVRPQAGQRLDEFSEPGWALAVRPGCPAEQRQAGAGRGGGFDETSPGLYMGPFSLLAHACTVIPGRELVRCRCLAVF